MAARTLSNNIIIRFAAHYHSKLLSEALTAGFGTLNLNFFQISAFLNFSRLFSNLLP